MSRIAVSDVHTIAVHLNLTLSTDEAWGAPSLQRSDHPYATILRKCTGNISSLDWKVPATPALESSTPFESEDDFDYEEDAFSQDMSLDDFNVIIDEKTSIMFSPLALACGIAWLSSAPEVYLTSPFPKFAIILNERHRWTIRNELWT